MSSIPPFRRTSHTLAAQGCTTPTGKRTVSTKAVMRTKSAPEARAMAKRSPQSAVMKETPMGTDTTWCTAPQITLMAASCRGPRVIPMGRSRVGSTSTASNPACSSFFASATALATTASMLPQWFMAPGSGRQCTMPMSTPCFSFISSMILILTLPIFLG